MSLDVYLCMPGHVQPAGSGIFIRADGGNREITREEWDRRFPGREPVAVVDDEPIDVVYHGNVTHNLAPMAKEAGLYDVLWRPGSLVGQPDATQADGLIASRLTGSLIRGLQILERDPERFLRLNPRNDWGTYEGLCQFIAEYLAACVRHPGAAVRVWR